MTAPRNAPPDGEHLGRFDLEGFIYAVATAQPLPAGGAVAALVGALAAALAEMCAGLTARQPGYAAAEAEMRAIARQAAQWRAALLRAIDEDMAAYRQYMAARRLPVDTTAQRQQRRKALQRATRAATLAPLNVAQLATEVLDFLATVAERGVPNVVGDAAMGAHLAEAVVRGSVLNARLNLRGYTNARERDELLRHADQLVAGAERTRGAIVQRAMAFAEPADAERAMERQDTREATS